MRTHGRRAMRSVSSPLADAVGAVERWYSAAYFGSGQDRIWTQSRQGSTPNDLWTGKAFGSLVARDGTHGPVISFLICA